MNIKLTKIVLVEYELNLSRYTEQQLKQLWRDGVITHNELNDELDSRERMATINDRAS